MKALDYLKDKATGRNPKGSRRSPLWAETRDIFLKSNPTCVCCGGDKNLVVHHVIPFHIAPSLELDPDNLMTVCTKGRGGISNCHLLAHSGNWRSYDMKCREKLALIRQRFVDREGEMWPTNY